MNTTTKPGVLAVMDLHVEMTEYDVRVDEQPQENLDNLREARATVERLAEAVEQITRITAPGESDPVLAFAMLKKIDGIATAALAAFRGEA